MDKLIKITPNKEKAKSILKMVESTLDMIRSINLEKFSSNATKEYYEVIRELITIVLLLDGYKTFGEGAHKNLIEYLKSNYSELNDSQIALIDDLRIIRNKISYDGFFVTQDYLKRKLKYIEDIILKLKKIVLSKLED
jgi:hypothetical protein